MTAKTMRTTGISLLVLFASASLIYIMRLVASSHDNPTKYAYFCKSTAGGSQPKRWTFAIFLDINSCLSCTEDMDMWRELDALIASKGGALLLCATHDDSSDVVSAMQLERIHTPVTILDDEVVGHLGLTARGTPLKILLDESGKTIKIAGRLGNVAMSKCFLDSIKTIISDDIKTTAQI